MFKKINDTISLIFTEGGFTHSNSVFINDQQKTLIDSGAGKILKKTEPKTIDTLLLTHHHLDHISGNDYFSNASIHAHEYEKNAMLDPMKTTATFGWGELMEEDVNKYADNLTGKTRRVLEPWTVHKTIKDREIIDCGKTKIMVLHTPGHTAGHCSFYFPDEEFVYSGDICLSRIGPWYADPDTSIEDFTRSVDLLIGLKPKMLATGHWNELITDNITKKLTEYKERIYKREKRLIRFLKNGPSSIDRMAQEKIIYNSHASNFILFWEKSMLKKHLDRLMANLVVEQTDNSTYALTK